MLKFKTIRTFGLVLLPLLCASTLGWAAPPAQSGTSALPGQGNGIGIHTPPGQSLTEQEREEAVAALLTHPSVSERIKTHKVRVVRVTHGFEQTNPNNGKQEEYRVAVLLFDYTTGKATRFGLDPESGDVVSEELVRGRPQASKEEIELATKIIRQNVALSRLLSSSGQVMGGFIVDGPPGAPATHRYLQMRIVTDDLRETKRVLLVDLTDETVASFK